MKDYTFKDLSIVDEIESIAVIGASKKRGFFFLHTFYETFNGRLYAVNPGLKRIESMPEVPVFDTVSSIPDDETVNFAFITVPSSIVPSVIADCVCKGVEMVAVFTANFADAGTDEGKRLQAEMLKIANSNLRILGPNGMGLFYPAKGIRWRSSLPSASGHIGIVAQSGGLCNLMIHGLTSRGHGISKALSIGNAADVNLLDALNYFLNDRETDVVVAYIEGIPAETGRILIRLLRRAKKPVIILKGGKTKTGSHAAKSHTASLVGDNKIWSAALDQAGVLRVSTLTDLFNLVEILECYISRPITNICVASLSGGYGVLCTDTLIEHGLNLPTISQDLELNTRLSTLFTAKGTSHENPLDLAVTIYEPEKIGQIFKAVLESDIFDCLIFEIAPLYLAHSMRKDIDLSIELTAQLRDLKQISKKAILCIVQNIGFSDEEHRIKKMLRVHDIPVFDDILPIARVLAVLQRAKKHRIGLIAGSSC